MRLRVRLSEQSISRAISRLRESQDNLRWGVNDTLQLLAKDGAMVANSKYGSMANAIDWMEDETVGKISVVGKIPLIAEFGAGDATQPPLGMFENEPDIPVYPGSYSELEGSGEYAREGRWHFGGKTYTEIEPRYGLYNAKNYIEKNAVHIAKEVIEL